jgi:hypothetical protein
MVYSLHKYYVEHCPLSGVYLKYTVFQKLDLFLSADQSSDTSAFQQAQLSNLSYI